MPVGERSWVHRVEECIATLVASFSGAPELDDIATLIVESVVATLAPTVLAVYRTSEAADALELLAHRGLPLAVVERLRAVPIADGGVLGHAARGGTVERIDLTTADPSHVEAIAPEAIVHVDPRATMEVATPFVVCGRLFGAMEIAVDRPEPVTDAAAARLLTLGQLIGLAFAASDYRAAAHASAVHAERAREAQRAVITSLSVLPESQLQAAVRRGFYVWPQHLESSVPEFIESVIQRVADEARELVAAEISAIGVGDLPDRSFSPWTFSGVPEGTFERIGRAPRPVGTLGVVACEGQTVRIPNVQDHPRFRGLPPGHPRVTSLLGVPIRYRGRSLGNLYLANKIGAQEFSVEDQRAVEMLAEQAGMALQQAFLQASIEAQRAQTQSLLDSAPHGILFVDSQTRNVMANPSAMALLDGAVSPEAGIEQFIERIRYPDGQPVPPEATPAYRALQGEEHARGQFVIVRRDGRETPIIESAAPVRGFGRKLLGAVVNFEDVSAVRDLERARHVERVREELNATIAHDLRNPIQTVLAQIYLLLRQADGEEVTVPVRALQRIERSARTLARMAGVLLDVSRIELKRVELHREPARLTEVVAELIDRMRPAFSEDGHHIELTTEACPTVGLDTLAFEQILTNLVDNAGKFSPKGAPIRVTVRACDGGALVSVRDEGPGISRDKQARLFDRFYVTEGVRQQKTGLGLGLFIVKGLVEAHGGRVSIDSDVGRGTRFDVWFPPLPLTPG